MTWRDTPARSARSAGYAGPSFNVSSADVRVGSDRAWPKRASASLCVEISTPQTVHRNLYSANDELSQVHAGLLRRAGERDLPRLPEPHLRTTPVRPHAGALGAVQLCLQRFAHGLRAPGRRAGLREPRFEWPLQLAYDGLLDGQAELGCPGGDLAGDHHA